MSNFTYRGPVGSDPNEVCSIYDDRLIKGVNTRSDGAVIKPGPVEDTPTFDLSLADRGKFVLERSIDRVPPELREQYAALLTLEGIAAMGAIMSAAILASASGIPQLIFLAGAIFFLLTANEAYEFGKNLGLALRLTRDARSEHDLEQAADHLAKAIVAAGSVVVLKALKRIAGMAKKGKGPKKEGPQPAALDAVVPLSYMPVPHKHAFMTILGEKVNGRKIVGVVIRQVTKPMSAQRIKEGFPGKPGDVPFKTSEGKGIATITPQQALDNKFKSVEEAKAAMRTNGHLVVDDDMVARGADPGHQINLSKSGWAEPGQVIDRASGKGFTSDYDLAAVILEGAESRNLGSVPKVGKNVTDPAVEYVARRFREITGADMVRHGPQEKMMPDPAKFTDKKPYDMFKEAGVVDVIRGDGSVHALQPDQFEKLYTEEWKRLPLFMKDKQH